MKLMFVLLFIITTFNAMAEEFRVARITSDIDRNLTEFLMDVDNEKDIHSIRIKTTTPAGRIIKDFSYTAEQVMNGGVVLDERDGHKAVRLKVAKDFTARDGGDVILDYLYSGVTGTRYFLSLKLVRKDGAFLLQKKTGDPVNNFFFRANRHRILGIIGVREIILSHQ